MKKINTFKIIILGLCSIATIGLFFPYEKSTGEYRQNLKDNPTRVNVEEVNFTNKDVIDISILENLKVYCYAMNNTSGDDWIRGEATVNVIISSILIASIILITLFTLLNKSILTILFSILVGICSFLMNFDIVERGVIPSSKYTYGIAYYLYVPLAIMTIICSILIIINNKKQKKNNVN